MFLRSRLRALVARVPRTAILSFIFAFIGLGLSVNWAHAEGASIISGAFDGQTQSILLEWLLSALAQMVHYLTAGLGQLTLVVIESLLVPILQYNGFSTSPTIGLGWSLVRDVVNMFVVIVLLYIAITTMLGVAKQNWQQSLPQLFLAVVFLNFSRTICGFLIDISQVIMFTFVNALLDIAAGNFAQLWGINDFGNYSLDWTASVANADRILTAGVHLSAAYLEFALYAAIFSIMLLLALAFIYRIIVLWILVIMSPLAFFLYGLRPLGIGGGAWGNWVGKFSAALTMGPMLTFFLWLALAASSSGSILISENFPQPDSPHSYGLPLEVFQSDHLTGLLLAFVLLVVGMQQASSSAASVGGWAGSLINEKRGRGIVAGALRFPLTAGRPVGRAAGSLGGYLAPQLDRRLAPEGSSRLSEALGANIIRTTGAPLAGVPVIGGVLSRTGIAAGGALQSRGEAVTAAETKAAQGRLSKYTDDQLIEHYRLINAGQTSPLALNAKDDVNALRARLVSSVPMQIGLKKALGDKESEKAIKEAIHYIDPRKGALLDDSGREKLDGTKSKYLHLIKDLDPKKSAEENLRSFVKSDQYTAAKTSDRALADQEVQEVLKKEKPRNSRNDEDTYYSRFAAKKYAGRLPEAVSATASEPVAAAAAGAPVEAPSDTPADAAARARNEAAAAAAVGGGIVGATIAGSTRPPRRPRGGGGGGRGGNGGGTPPAGGTPPPAPAGGGGPSGGPGPAPTSGGAGGAGGSRASGSATGAAPAAASARPAAPRSPASRRGASAGAGPVVGQISPTVIPARSGPTVIDTSSFGSAGAGSEPLPIISSAPVTPVGPTEVSTPAATSPLPRAAVSPRRPAAVAAATPASEAATVPPASPRAQAPSTSAAEVTQEIPELPASNIEPLPSDVATAAPAPVRRFTPRPPATPPPPPIDNRPAPSRAIRDDIRQQAAEQRRLERNRRATENPQPPPF